MDRTRGRLPGGCGVCFRVTGTPDGILDTLLYVNSYRTRFPKACGVGFSLGHVELEERWDVWGRGCTAGGRLPGSRAWETVWSALGMVALASGMATTILTPHLLTQSPLSSRQGWAVPPLECSRSDGITVQAINDITHSHAGGSWPPCHGATLKWPQGEIHVGGTRAPLQQPAC